MLIVSKFHDYYDSIMKCGVDKTIVYNRETKPIEKKDLKKFGLERGSGWYLDRDRQLYYQQGWIMFCGKTYPVCRLRQRMSYEPAKEFFCYDMEKVNDIIKENSITKKSLHMFSYEKVNETFRNSFVATDCVDILVHFNVPIIASLPFLDSDFVLNPSLKEVDFYRIVDPYSAFQEISSFVSGVLTNVEDKMVKIDDESMKVKKGFDDWSFKTKPGTKKKRKKK